MPKFGITSQKRLDECHVDIQTVMNIAIKQVDFSIIEGQRSKEKQNEYVKKGLSKLKYPASKHNKSPSMAVDIAPYTIDWHDEKRFCLLAGRVLAIAKSCGIKMRWGGDWDQNDRFNESFVDMPHFELLD